MNEKNHSFEINDKIEKIIENVTFEEKIENSLKNLVCKFFVEK
jgi:hypothetical protein